MVLGSAKFILAEQLGKKINEALTSAGFDVDQQFNVLNTKVWLDHKQINIEFPYRTKIDESQHPIIRSTIESTLNDSTNKVEDVKVWDPRGKYKGKVTVRIRHTLVRQAA